MNSDAFADLPYGNDADVHQLKHQPRITEEVLKTANADRDRLQELDLEEAKAKALIRTAADQLRGDRRPNVIASTTYEPRQHDPQPDRAGVLRRDIHRFRADSLRKPQVALASERDFHYGGVRGGRALPPTASSRAWSGSGWANGARRRACGTRRDGQALLF